MDFTGLTDMRTNCHRTVPTLSHGIAVCPTCGSVVADLAYTDEEI
jgi:ribosomal protein L37AE/L43A